LIIVRNFLCVFMTIFFSKHTRRFRVQRILIRGITVDVRDDVPVGVIQSGAILKKCDLTYRYGTQNNL